MSAKAITLTFPGATGPFSGSVSEGIFTYDEFSGGLLRNATIGTGNPEPHLEGELVSGGGVLRIFRNDVAGGLFTFDAADVAVFTSDASVFDGNDVTVQGFLLGLPQFTDTLVTAGNGNWVTRSSVLLNGVLLDELRITLDAETDFETFAGWENLDNVVLSPQTASVPDPGATLLLLLTSCAALGGLRRRIAR